MLYVCYLTILHKFKDVISLLKLYFAIMVSIFRLLFKNENDLSLLSLSDWQIDKTSNN